MVFQSTWLIDFYLCRIQQLALLPCLHWLSVRYRVIFKILLLTYKALNGQAPGYIKDLLKYKNSGRVLRSSNKHLRDEPLAKLKTYDDGAYSVAAP